MPMPRDYSFTKGLCKGKQGFGGGSRLAFFDVEKEKEMG